MKPRLFFVILLLFTGRLFGAGFPPVQSSDFVLRDFHFRSGEVLPELRIHYRAIGSPRFDKRGLVENAVLILHGTTGNGSNFLRPEFAGELFNPGQPLDASRYFVILPDNIGHGQSSRPSDGLHAKFPHYGYRDMVEAQHRLLAEGLGVQHLRLIIGTSMGCMHAWMWAGNHPESMDALLPIACLPAPIAGRNRMERRLIVDAIRNDPEWQAGDYARQPQGLVTALRMIAISAGSTRQLYLEAPTVESTDSLLDRAAEQPMRCA